jgi:hypothetical protein
MIQFELQSILPIFRNVGKAKRKQKEKKITIETIFFPVYINPTS